MKIGILTFYTSNDNYGQQLQSFALQQKIKKMGHEAYLIRYDLTYYKPKPLYMRVLKAFNPVKLYTYIKSLIIKRKNSNNDLNRNFIEFRKKYFDMYPVIYKNFDEINNNPPVLDAYIVGSDQVWNWDNGNNSFDEYIKTFFLGFGSSNIIRISYAASWGGKIPGEDESILIEKYLKEFDLVTVREEEGIDICKKCGRSEVFLVQDPTLLLSVDDYKKLYKENKIKKPQKDYVLFYYANNGGTFNIEQLYKWAKEKNLDVQYISANGQYDKYEKNYATIPEWIYLVEHASYVVTNSFHCCVFSLLFEKKFGAIAIIGKSKGMNTRLETLFKECNVAPRYITDDDYSALELPSESIHIDYSNSDRVWDFLSFYEKDN